MELGYGLALVIGIVLGILGAGGAILTVPVFHYVLGYDVKTAIPMALVVVGFSAAFGAIVHGRRGAVDLRSSFAFGPPAILGSLLGADLGLRVDSRIQMIVLAIVLVLASLSMLRSAGVAWVTLGGGAMPGAEERPRPARPLPLVTLAGALVGTITGFTGVGGGFLYVPALTVLMGLPIKRAIGTSLVLILLGCAAAALRYQGSVTLDWKAIGIFPALAAVGVAIGSALVPHVSHRALRKGFAIFLLVMGAFVLLRSS
jgi:uncharacterized membrane protein YfcA